MRTLNRQTASSNRSTKSPEALSGEARSLWLSTPSGDLDEREVLVVELINLEFDIERLLFREIIGELRTEDLQELESCSRRLSELESRWQPDVEASLLGLEEVR